MSELKKHTRVNDILLGPLERPALNWFAAHMPRWITPDICTIIGVIGAVIIAGSYILSRSDRNFLWLASLGFVINWFGDSMDGTLARYRKIERPVFGFFIDHIVDAGCQVIIFLGLGLTTYVNFDIACLTLVAYLLLSILAYVRTYAVGEFKISYGKLGPTEVRVLAILLNTGMFFGGMSKFTFARGNFSPFYFSIYDVIVSAIAFLLLYFFITTAAVEAIRLSKAGK